MSAARSRRQLALAALIVGAALAVRFGLGTPLRVQTEGMEPTIWRGELVLMRRGGLAALAPGDLVVAELPGEGLIVKRLVATEGQAIEVHPTRGLIIDGEARDTGALRSVVRPSGPCGLEAQPHAVERWPAGEVAVRHGGPADRRRVPPGHVYLLGDDRAASGDSRLWGPVPVEQVVGTVSFTLFSKSACDLSPRWRRSFVALR